MKINFITTFLITYLIQIPYVYAEDIFYGPECWTSVQNCEKTRGKLVTYEFVATEELEHKTNGETKFKITPGATYSLKACQTFLPSELPESFTGPGRIVNECNDDSPTLPCYKAFDPEEPITFYRVASDFKVSIFDADSNPPCAMDTVQNICVKPKPFGGSCYIYQQGSKECFFTVNPRDTNFDIKANCVLEVSKVDPNDPRLQFVRNGKKYSCATQLGEHAKFVKPFIVPIIESPEDGTIKNPGGQNSLDDCVLKQGSKDTPYEDDAGQYIFTSGTCSDLYCTDITADLCGAVS